MPDLSNLHLHAEGLIYIERCCAPVQDDFNAVVPMSALTQVYIAYTNQSQAVGLLQPDGPSKPYRLL